MTKRKLRVIAGPLMAAMLFLLAVRLLVNEANSITPQDFLAGLISVPPTYLGLAILLAGLNYGMYIGYDILALRYICRSLPLRRVSLVSFLGFALGNSLGTFLAAAPIRFRFYGRWGFSASQIVAVISMVGLTFWSGLWFLGGVVLIWVPMELPPPIDLPFGTRTLGVILLTVAISYAVVCFVWRKPWPIGALRLRPPTPGLMAVQASVAAVDLFISATVLYLVLPGDAVVPFPVVMAAYLVGIAVSLLTQVPGGLGVLEVILLGLLKGNVGGSVLASLLIFRLVYFVIPLIVGMMLLVAHEIYNGAMEAHRAARTPLDLSRVSLPANLSPQEND